MKPAHTEKIFDFSRAMQCLTTLDAPGTGSGFAFTLLHPTPPQRQNEALLPLPHDLPPGIRRGWLLTS